MISVDRVVRGITNYLDNELVPMIFDNTKKIGFGLFVALAARNPINLLNQFISVDLLQALGLFNEDKTMVDVDVLREELRKRMPTEGLKMNLPLVGTVTLSSGDIDKLYSYIMSA